MNTTNYPSHGSTSPERIRVLHVDDEPDFAELAAEFLEQDDRLSVETATHAGEGMERLADNDFDCIVSDYDMPGRNGIEFLETVREEYPDLPFILYTGKGSEEVASDAISAGVTDYLQKESGTEQYELLANRIANAVDQFRAERRARLQKRQYRELIEGAPIMDVLVRDENGRPVIENCNDRFVEKLGYDREEIIGRPMTDVYTEESIAEAFEHGGYERALTGEFEREERTLVTKGGETIDTIVRASPRLDETGEVVGFQGLYLDITDRRERERALRETKERLELALDSANLGTWDWNVETGEVTYDARWAEMLGYSLEELGPDVNTWREKVHPDDIGRVDEVVNEHFEGETDHYQCDHRMRTKSGGWKWIRSIGKVVERDQNGEPVRTVGIHQDITDQKERERELERYETILEALGDPVYAIDSDGCYTFVNDAFVEETGYPKDEIIGDHASRVLPEDDLEKARQVNRELLADDERTKATVELERITADGERIQAESHIALLPPGEDGEFRGVAGVVRDITERKEREQELIQYRRIVEALGDGVYVMDADGEFVKVNDQLAEMAGYDRETILAEGPELYFDPTDIKQFEQAIERLLTRDKQGHEQEIETVTAEMNRPDGRTVPTETNIAILASDDFRGTVGVVRDISEQKKRERELERYETVVEALGDPVYALDADGHFTFVNEAYAEFGYAKEDLIGNHTSRVIDDHDVQRGREIIQGLLRSDDRTSATYEMEFTTADGDRIPTENHLALLPPGDDGEFRGTAGIIRDITERKEREQELERYETMVNTAGDMVYILDTDGRFEFVNDAAETLTGYSREQLRGSHVDLIMEEQDIEIGRTLINGLLRDDDRDRSSDSLSWTLHTADGETIPCESHVTLLYESGEWRGTVGVVRDITERVERERELERQNDRLDEFAGIVSHDLRNPLNVAEGRLELAREECDSEHLDAVERSHQRMETLIEDLLTLAQEGEAVNETEPVDLAELIENCWRNVDTADATLVTETDATILADQSRLQQLLENLYRNAVEHGGEKVTVTVGDLADRDGIYVADDGPGIRKDEKGRVFESGYSTTDDGTGFGLAIAKEIAEAHGWTISVTDSADGGARFEITDVEST